MGHLTLGLWSVVVVFVAFVIAREAHAEHESALKGESSARGRPVGEVLRETLNDFYLFVTFALSRMGKINGGARAVKGFFDGFYEGAVVRVGGSLHKLTRAIIVNVNHFSFFRFFVSHNILRRFLYFTLLFVVINVLFGLVPPPDEDFVCPDGMAYGVPMGEPNAGRYLRCEQFDQYYELMSVGKSVEAATLLLPRAK